MDRLVQLMGQMLKIEMPDYIKQRIVELFKEEKIEKDERLLEIGDTPTKLYFVTSGLLRSYCIDPKGNDITRYFFTEGKLCCGEALALSRPSLVCIEALEESILFSASQTDVLAFIEEDFICLRAWNRMLEEGIYYKVSRENGFLMKSATERYMDFRQEYPYLEQRVQQGYIASYLGITPVSLSRIRKNLKKNL